MKAHLRGLLKPTGFGSTEFAQETYVLEALELEDQASHLERLTRLTSVMLAGGDLTSQSRQKILSGLIEKLGDIHLLGELNLPKYLEETSVLAAEDLYDLLKAEGMIGE